MLVNPYFTKYGHFTFVGFNRIGDFDVLAIISNFSFLLIPIFVRLLYVVHMFELLKFAPLISGNLNH